jgi:hypothetical protein
MMDSERIARNYLLADADLTLTDITKSVSSLDVVAFVQTALPPLLHGLRKKAWGICVEWEFENPRNPLARQLRFEVNEKLPTRSKAELLLGQMPGLDLTVELKKFPPGDSGRADNL